MKKNCFKKRWINSNFSIIKMIYPTVDEVELKEALSEIYNEELKDEDVRIENNYTKTSDDMKLTKFVDWYFNNKPITTEYGVMFKQHDEATSVVNEMVDDILKKRKVYKNLRNDNLSENGNPLLAAFYDLRQQVMKIFANSIYGVLGNKMFIFYNIFNAEAITKKGQNMITNCYATFENFLEDNIPFMDMNDFLVYVNNIITEEYKYDIMSLISEVKTSDDLKKRLRKKFYNNKIIDDEIFEAVIDNLDEEEIQKVFYKNNFQGFCKNKKIKKLFKKVLVNDVVFRDPNELPEEIKAGLKKIWAYMEDIVFYNHLIAETRKKFKTLKRKVVVLVDTDSNMINLDHQYHFFVDMFDLDHDKETEYRIINTVSFVLIEMVNTYLNKFSEMTGIKDPDYWRLVMKNEFLFFKLLLTKGKKNYAGLIDLQEGKQLPRNKQLQLKGISIRKNNVNKKVAKYLSDLLEEKILRAEDFKTKEILDDLETLADNIRESFENGETTYMTPASSKAAEKYDFPLRNKPLRGIMVWNHLYPNKEITFPAEVNTVKLTSKTLQGLKVIKRDFPKEYKAIKKFIFNDPEFANYGFDVMSIPKDNALIPEWVRPLIDVDTIVIDNLSNFLPLSESIGIKTIYSTKDTKFISNIVEF